MKIQNQPYIYYIFERDIMKSRWYKDAVIYQIYPRSFKDSNGDGIGDIKGITEKLDYIKDLGVDAVWLSPCYKSPNDDNGYDISDYCDIMDDFGTLEDWQEMIDGLHKRGIKLIMDLVVNHTSDEHVWFKEAIKSKDNPYHDYYIWRKGNGKRPPNNWQACFTGSAWQYVEHLDEYYLHLFSVKQPDLNWRNEKVREEVKNICKYWLDKGVDGFRCDVITYIAKPENMNGNISYSAYVTGEHWEEYINELARECWNKYDTLIVGEATGVNKKRAEEITDEKKELLDTLFHFEHMQTDAYFGYLPKKLDLVKFKRTLSNWQRSPRSVWQSLYYENHDQPRSIPRFMPSGKWREYSAKALATSLFFQRGTPYIFEGQEIGMTNARFTREEFKDIASINILKVIDKRAPFLSNFAIKALNIKARDHARTPMQWSRNKNAGFTDGTPWMKINDNYKEINVEDDLKDENSVLNFYKKMLKVRKEYIDITRDGDYNDIDIRNRSVFAYSRTLNDKKLVVLVNFKSKPSKVKLDGIKLDNAKVILNNAGNVPFVKNGYAMLAPCQSVVYALSK